MTCFYKKKEIYLMIQMIYSIKEKESNKEKKKSNNRDSN
jgi:hypothetical protein